MAQGDEPELARAQRLTDGETGVLRDLGDSARGGGAGGRRGRNAIDDLAVVLGAVADELGGGDAEGENDEPRAEGRGLPAERVDGQNDEIDEHTPHSKAARGEADGRSAVALEPVDDRHHHGEEAAQAHANGDDEEGGEEVAQLRYPAEEHEPPCQQHQPNADDGAGTEAVGEPALAGANDAVRALDGGEAEGEHGAAPAKLLPEDSDVGAVGLHDECAYERGDDHSGADDPPAVVEAVGMGYVLRPRQAVENGGLPQAAPRRGAFARW